MLCRHRGSHLKLASDGETTPDVRGLDAHVREIERSILSTGEVMTQQSKAPGMSGRALALARRKALSDAGKRAMASSAPSPMRGRADARVAPAGLPPGALTSVPTKETVAMAAPTSQPRPAVRARVTADAPDGSSRSAALARRKAMSSKGKVAASHQDRVRDAVRARPKPEAASVAAAGKEGGCGCGCKGNGEREDTAPNPAPSAAVSRNPATNGWAKVRGPRRKDAQVEPGRAASLARRRAQSARGKAGMGANGMTAAQTARATNPDLSGRELAKALRDLRSRRGSAGQKKSAPTGRNRATRTAAPQGAAQDAPWKVGASKTSYGQTVTGTMVGRSRDVTGDEASTCRTVTGTEYMGADIFREFCQAEPVKAPRRVGVSPTTGGNRVTGSELGRSPKVTGDEPGTCKIVTGTEYLGANLQEAFCGIKPEKGPAKISTAETRGGKRVTGSNVGRSGKVTGDEVGAERTLTGTQYTRLGEPAPTTAPPKVGISATLRGGVVTGTMVGRHAAMTGDEAGSCRNVTGDDYIGQEQYVGYCDAAPTRKERKVGVSATLGGERITGTMTGRAPRVTGDEPGTCKAVTGTPYAGAEQYAEYCEPSQTGSAKARMQGGRRLFGSVMTGIQPSVGGKATGDEKGACEPVTGTPYLGADQVAAACPVAPAEPGSPDFPQALDREPWGGFSILPPAHAAQAARTPISGVTGSPFEGGRITGPFGMATGKVTGTEEARFGRGSRNPIEAQPPAEAPLVSGRVKSRITGEGQDAGHKITGDDWDRGDRVTGTEGTSALARNPSRRGPTLPMAAAMAKGRPEGVPEPVSKVTGGSGNTDKGALITYSGGARG